MDFIFKLGLIFVFVQVVQSKSIRNDTDSDSRMELMEIYMDKLEQRILNLTNEVTMLSKRKNDEHVMFYVTLSSDIVLNINSIVKFNEIQYEEGANFNTGDGVFVSPVSGIFMFSWTIRTSSGNHVDTEFRVDNVVKSEQLLSAVSGYLQTTQSIICQVKEGDHVWIQTGEGYSSVFHFDESYGSKSSFMGILIHRL